MSNSEIETFLNYLVSQRRLSASSQSQALNALIFMYKHVLELDPGWLKNLSRAKRKQFLPTVLSVSEVRDILGHMSGTTKLMAELIYGTGMRVNECTQLCIKDIDFHLNTIMVRQAKGGKDRSTLLPQRLIKPLQQHLLKIMGLHKDDCLKGAGYAHYRVLCIKNIQKPLTRLDGSMSFHPIRRAFGHRRAKPSDGTAPVQHHSEHLNEH